MTGKRCRFSRLILAPAVLGCLGAAPPELPPSRTPPPSGPTIMPQAPMPRVWDQIQDPLNRSTGRIVDEPSFQLNQLQRMREDRARQSLPSQSAFDRLQTERERQLRIEQRNRELQNATERQRREELDRREYELFLDTGSSDVSQQVMEDEQALNAAKARRDEQMIAAQNAETQALREQPNNATQIRQQFQKQMEQIRQVYEAERARILGLPLNASAASPATQPSTKPG